MYGSESIEPDCHSFDSYFQVFHCHFSNFLAYSSRPCCCFTNCSWDGGSFVYKFKWKWSSQLQIKPRKKLHLFGWWIMVVLAFSAFFFCSFILFQYAIALVTFFAAPLKYSFPLLFSCYQNPCSLIGQLNDVIFFLGFAWLISFRFCTHRCESIPFSTKQIYK